MDITAAKTSPARLSVMAALVGLVLLAFAVWAGGAHAQRDTAARVSSPDGRTQVEVWAENGQAFYAVGFGDSDVIRPSRLGFRFLDGVDLDRGLIVAGVTDGQADTRWEQPWGEKRAMRDRHRWLRVDFQKDGVAAFTVEVRAADDGVGLRYVVPADTGAPLRRLAEELTEFNLAPVRTAWWIPAGEWNRYEYLYRTTGLDALYRAHTPATFRLEGGTYLALHEAALVDYPAMWLEQRRPGTLKADLAPHSEGHKARLEGDFTTPWRTFQMGERAVDLINSDLILNLNEPNALGDVSWVKPGRYVGIWWCMHINRCTWGSGDKHGATTPRTKEYIDFAAKYGFSGVLVEGWNTGWDGDWFNNGELFSFTEAYPDFDIAALSAYALERGVRLIGHHETSANSLNYEAQLEAALDLYQRLGITQVKTGYVADGGDFVTRTPDGRRALSWHDGQEAVVHHLKVVREAAKRFISVNPHEPVKDTGLRRTYPNWITREGARGQEYNAWGQPPNPPEHETLLAFTRMLAGPMDFTPGIFDLTFGGPLDAPTRVQTTLAKQLALYVVLYSPVQMAADLPENYEARPDAFEFVRSVPTDWDRSIAIDGEPGEFVVIARKDRNGPDWFIGAITDEKARTVAIPLDFLEGGAQAQWTATLYADGPGADWASNPYAFVRETRLVGARTVLKLTLAPGGGAAVRLSPAGGVQSVADTLPLGVGSLLKLNDFPGTGLISREVQIWLPPGYDAPGAQARHPVLYMHDGQALFEPGRSLPGDEWGVDETLTRLIADGAIRAPIVVGVGNTQERWRDYAPAGVVARLPEALRGTVEAETGGEPKSDAYLRFLTQELKPYIDANYRTLPGPQDTMIMGSSMGGLISLYAAGEYPDVFGGAAALSTHWPLWKPDSMDQVAATLAMTGWLEASGLDPRHQRLWFDHGTLNLDAFYGPYQQVMDRWFVARGFNRAENFSTRVYEGTDHNEASWAARLADPLVFLLGK